MSTLSTPYQREEEVERFQSLKQNKKMWERINALGRGAPKPTLPAYVRRADGKIVTEPVDMYNAMAENFENVSKTKLGNDDGSFTYDVDFKLQIEEELEQFRQSNSGVSSGPLDELWADEEYALSVKNMKSGKAPGPWGVSPELIKEANADIMSELEGEDRDENTMTDFHDHMMLVYNSGLSEQHYPNPLRDGGVKSLHKGGSTWWLKNYRPITLLSYLAKNLGAMMGDRLLSWAESNGHLADEQGGFRRGRSTAQQLVALSSILKHRKRCGVSTVVGFLDVSKAYDQVWRDGLLHELHEKGLTGRMWGLVASSLKTMRRKMRTSGECDEAKLKCFQPEEGVTQGAPESPIYCAPFS